MPLLLALMLAVLALGASAQARSKLAAKFKGQLLVSDQPFQVTDDAAAAKKNAKTELVGKTSGDEGTSWDFSFLGVLKAKPGNTKAVLSFVDSKTGTQAT
jgi:hypothetical protein